MKHRSPLRSFLAAFAGALLAAALTPTAHAAEPSAKAAATVGVLAPVDAKTDATWLAQARATYPLDFCPVCDDKIPAGASPKVPEYTYRVAGQPDRLVRFCSDDDCIPKFKSDPAKYLKMIDDAAAAKSPAGKK
jgi:hypothetical protein